MVDREGVVKLIDFGLTIPNKPEFCKPGNRTGTTDYLAPELIRRVTTDHRVDLFALGVTAYEMFTLGLPWEKATSQQTLLNHMNSPAAQPARAESPARRRDRQVPAQGRGARPGRALPDRRRVPRGAAEAAEEALIVIRVQVVWTIRGRPGRPR